MSCAAPRGRTSLGDASRSTRVVRLAGIVLCLWATCGHTSTLHAQATAGTVSGQIVDDAAEPVRGATVTLVPSDGHVAISAASRQDGRFQLASVPPGPFLLTVSSPGFASQSVSGVAAAGAATDVEPMRLTLEAAAVSVEVRPTQVEVADRQIKAQEQQRVLGVIPNFYVSYDPNAAPLNTRQKFELSWKTQLDPIRFGFVAIVAGVQYSRNDFPAFGRGPSGYAKRYAAAYASAVTGSIVSRVVMPAVFRQDPRYFYKGTGSVGSRIIYAASRSVIRKGDNGRWQPNYSSILGSLVSGALSNVYYPAADRKSAGLMLQNTAISLGAGAVGRLAQEFLFSKVTSRRRADAP